MKGHITSYPVPCSYVEDPEVIHRESYNLQVIPGEK